MIKSEAGSELHVFFSSSSHSPLELEEKKNFLSLFCFVFLTKNTVYQKICVFIESKLKLKYVVETKS